MDGDDWHPTTWTRHLAPRVSLIVDEIFPRAAQGMARYRYRLVKGAKVIALGIPGGYATPGDAMEAADAAAETYATHWR
jgi:hypothetical protein